MKNKYFYVVASLLGALAASPIANAANVDITIQDPYNGTSFGGGITTEDNEVEPGATADQTWDLEGFFLNSNNKLGIVAGFDMRTGEASGTGAVGGVEFEMGDIFVRIGSAVNPTSTTSDASDYVIRFTYSNGRDTTSASSAGTLNLSYSVYKTPTGITLSQGEAGGPGSINPSKKWYANGGTFVTSGTATYSDNVAVPTGLPAYAGTTHDVLGDIDLSWITAAKGTQVYLYTTMQCGNDVLTGKFTTVPDGGWTLALLGIGLAGISAVSRSTRVRA